MIKIGGYNKLKVVKSVDFGVYLDGEERGEILLPTRYLPENIKAGDEVDVFLYFDSEDRLIATTLHPYTEVGRFAFLRVVSLNRIGAFLDWGLPKDLLVPFREQRTEMQEGRSYIVYVYLDVESGRIAASAKTDRFLDNVPADYTFNQEVDILVTQKIDIGYKVIVNNLHSGMIYINEIFTDVNIGDRKKGYVKHIREDEKIDISLRKLGYESVEPISQSILAELKRCGGFLPFSDKSDSEAISSIFKCSKKNFKKAIGALYRERVINITPDGIELINK